MASASLYVAFNQCRLRSGVRLFCLKIVVFLKRYSVISIFNRKNDGSHVGSPAGGCPHALLRYCQKPVLRLKAQTSAAPVRGIAGMLKRTSMLISMHSLRLLSVLLLL
ncbi:MAG TPA: hypothetical protein PK971_09730, partial [Saprospiraceae bacterium]|nr:hypothetical protein [Saprospiraceae bacterium]